MHKHTQSYAYPNMEICGYERVHHRVNLAWNQWRFNWKACAAFSKITSLTQKSQAVWQRYFAGPWGQLQPGKTSPSRLSPHNHSEPVWLMTFSLSWTKILQATEMERRTSGIRGDNLKQRELLLVAAQTWNKELKFPNLQPTTPHHALNHSQPNFAQGP